MTDSTTILFLRLRLLSYLFSSSSSPSSSASILTRLTNLLQTLTNLTQPSQPITFFLSHYQSYFDLLCFSTTLDFISLPMISQIHWILSQKNEFVSTFFELQKVNSFLPFLKLDSSPSRLLESKLDFLLIKEEEEKKNKKKDGDDDDEIWNWIDRYDLYISTVSKIFIALDDQLSYLENQLDKIQETTTTVSSPLK